MAPRLLARVTGATVSGFFTELHRSRGVDIRVGVGVASGMGRDGAVTALKLMDGSQVEADVVIVAVGMRPNVSELVNAGASGDETGVIVDAYCRTSLDDVLR